jgi:NAD(P) transhydrogenase subunit beta
MSTFDAVVRLVYVAAAAGFVIGLHLMNSPATAARGNRLSAAAMAVAILTTGIVLGHDGAITLTGVLVHVAVAGVGGVAGLYAARRVAMTAMPQLVSLFNAVGGGAAALLAVQDLTGGATATTRIAVTGALDILIGAITFTGSLVAAGKLQGWVPGQPILLPGGRIITMALAAAGLGGGGWLIADPQSRVALVLLTIAALGFGITMVLPIGGADMPVVISLLNAFTGTAVAMAGFVLGNPVLIIAGALVGASGGILTKLMADAMNRSIASIIAGGFGTGDAMIAVGAGGAAVREVSADDVAIQLAYANKSSSSPDTGWPPPRHNTKSPNSPTCWNGAGSR